MIAVTPRRLPIFVRKLLLGELIRATAAGFGCPRPAVAGLSYAGRLRRYALFTREQAEKALQSGEDLVELRSPLYTNACHLGAKLRAWTGIKTLPEAVRLGRTLYRSIEIDLRGSEEGDLIVNRCYFSQFYTCQVCGLISALDDGLFSGLSGGGRLSFSERLTEGSACCRAKLAFPEEGAR